MASLHRPRIQLVIVIAAIAVAVRCAGAPSQRNIPLGKVDTGPGTLTEARKYLEGEWELMSMEIFPPNQPSIRAAATGTLVYDAFSNMKVDLQLSPETARIAESMGIPAPDGVVTTSGRTVIDINSHSISYVLEGQDSFRPPTHPLDMNRPRYWDVSGNMLTLRTKDESGKVLSVSVWQKK
jgi:hypothetical protein